MRDCPFCGNEVPVGAPRCKHCFGDLAGEEDSGKIGAPLVGVLVLLLFFLAVGGWTYQSMFDQSQLGNVTIDPKDERIVLVYTSTTGDPTTRQIGFDEIASLEMEANQSLMGGNYWEVFVVTSQGERVMINRSTSTTLQDYANTIAKTTNKSLTIINNIRSGQDTFGTGKQAGKQGGS